MFIHSLCLLCKIIIISITVIIPKCFCFMGSPPTNLPECLNSGTRTTINERYSCSCIDSYMNRQCKLLSINVANTPIEMPFTSFYINTTIQQTVHIGFQFITSDNSGNGTLFTLRNMNSTFFLNEQLIQIKVSLEFGRISVNFIYLSNSKTLRLPSGAVALNDNAWHYVDFFLNTQVNGEWNLVLLIDRCKYSELGPCMVNDTIILSVNTIQIGGYILIGDESGPSTERFRGCFDNVMVNRELIDFYPVLLSQGSRRGCPDSQKGCVRGNVKLCGKYGKCRNAISSTDILTCQCELGYRPNITGAPKPHRWPCETVSDGWSTTNVVYNALFTDKVPNRLRLSIRTRTQTFMVFAVGAWKLSISVSNGIPELRFDNTAITLSSLNISDGNWHVFEVTFTSRFLDFQVDELDKIYYDSRYFPEKSISRGSVDIIIANGAKDTCLDDAWIDFRNIWPDFEQDYPLEIISNPSFQRYTDWGTVGRQSGCSSGPGFCNSSKSLCDITASCIEEWRSYRCECLNNTVKDDKGKCVPSQCYPNPCVNGECHVLNGASNFTCICYGIWTGPLCNQVSSVNIAGLSWWWILFVVLLLLAILLATIFLIICCRKRREKKKSNLIDFNNELSDQKLGIDTQMNDPWSTGEKDFHGPIDYSVLKGNINSNPYQLTTNGSYQSNGYLPTSRKSDTNGSIDIQTFPSVTARAYGQKTTDIPPWESFDRQPNPAIRLDQVLEYGYEGYDGRPPPEFCPTEPVVSTSYDDYIGDDGDLNIENVQQSIKQPIANGKLNTLNK
ncbi:unnamed protein product [Schistosoma haematobium]|nr:unnamed protein product [Schistosoma haematobium]CAH8679615.1 unnamed protein product [Schistosoma haematobium]